MTADSVLLVPTRRVPLEIAAAAAAAPAAATAATDLDGGAGVGAQLHGAAGKKGSEGGKRRGSRRHNAPGVRQEMPRFLAKVPSMLADMNAPAADFLDPLLGRLTLSALKQLFIKELNHCLANLQQHSQSESRSTSKRHLLVSQLGKCFEKFERHLPPLFTAYKRIEAGERILDIQGLHDVADDVCFARYLDRSSTHASLGQSDTSTGLLVADDMDRGRAGSDAPDPRIMLSEAAAPSAQQHASVGGEDRTGLGRDVAKSETSVRSGGSDLAGSGSDGSMPVDAEAAAVSAKRTAIAAKAPSSVRHWELRVRAKYGRVLCRFLAQIEFDPFLLSDSSKRAILTVLRAVADIMVECSKRETTQWLVLSGTFHMRTIIDQLVSMGFDWPELFVKLEYGLGLFMSLEMFRSPDYLPWIMNNMAVLFKHVFHTQSAEDARSFVGKCFKEIESLGGTFDGASGSLDSRSFESRMEAIDSSLHRLNKWIFQCDMKDVAAGARLNYNPIPTTVPTQDPAMRGHSSATHGLVSAQGRKAHQNVDGELAPETSHNFPSLDHPHQAVQEVISGSTAQANPAGALAVAAAPERSKERLRALRRGSLSHNDDAFTLADMIDFVFSRGVGGTQRDTRGFHSVSDGGDRSSDASVSASREPDSERRLDAGVSHLRPVTEEEEEEEEYEDDSRHVGNAPMEVSLGGRRASRALCIVDTSLTAAAVAASMKRRRSSRLVGLTSVGASAETVSSTFIGTVGSGSQSVAKSTPSQYLRRLSVGADLRRRSVAAPAPGPMVLFSDLRSEQVISLTQGVSEPFEATESVNGAAEVEKHELRGKSPVDERSLSDPGPTAKDHNPHVVASLADSTIRIIRPNKSTGSVAGGPNGPNNPPKRPKMITAFTETDEQKVKRHTFQDVFSALNFFASDKDKFHAVVHGLYGLIPHNPSSGAAHLKFNEKAKDKDSPPLIAYLLDIGYGLLTSSVDSFSQKVLTTFFPTLATATIENDVHSQHQFINSLGSHSVSISELTAIIGDSRMERFAPHDITRFMRVLFEHRHWERFTVIAQVFEAMHFPTPKTIPATPRVPLRAEGARSEAPPWTASAEAELSLRIAAINYWNALHSDRHVLFGKSALDAKGTTASNVNLARLGRSALGTRSSSDGDRPDRAPSAPVVSAAARGFLAKLAVSDAVQTATIALLRAVSDGLDQPVLVKEAPRLFVDAAHLLWRLVEPVVRNLETFSDFQEMFEGLESELDAIAVLMRDEIFMVALEAISAIMSEFPDEDVAFGVTASKKLALFLECLELYDEALLVLSQTASGITDSRLRMIAKLEHWEAVTCNLGLHPTSVQSMFSNHESRLNSPEGQEVRKSHLDITCFQVDIALAIFRCEMKRDYKVSYRKSLKALDDFKRLTNKKIKNPPMPVFPIEERAKKLCGKNLVLQSLLQLTFAWESSTLSEHDREAHLTEAINLLKAEMKSERFLLEMLCKAPASAKPMKCPAPTVLKRTPTVVTLRPNHMVTEQGDLIIPMYYQAFGTKAGSIGVTLNDTKFEGCGRNLRATRAMEIQVTGLEPNQRYTFALAAFDSEGRMIGPGIGNTSCGVTTMLPLPIVLCWAYISRGAHELGYYDVADEAMQVLWSFFVKSRVMEDGLAKPATVGNTGVTHDSVFQIEEKNLRSSSSTIVLMFISCIHLELDRRLHESTLPVQADRSGSHNPLQSQLIRLKAARDLLVALEFARRIRNTQFIVSSAIRILEVLQPLFSFSVGCPFAVHCIFVGHAILCEHLPSHKNVDRAAILKDLLEPFSLQMCRRLVAWKEYAAAIKFAEDSLQLIASLAGTMDLRIMNSQYIEYQWTGTIPRTKKIKPGGKKTISTIVHNENVHHVILASGKTPLMGYTSVRKKVEIIVEQLECIIVQCTFLLRPPQVNDRKILDSHTTMKDLHMALMVSGPESVIIDLARFRKNPRYLEAVGACAEWCLNRGHLESASLVDGGVTRPRSQSRRGAEDEDEQPRTPASAERTPSPRASRSSSRDSQRSNALSGVAVRITKKRRKMAQRNMLLGALQAQDKERIEKAAGTLDNVLATCWKRRRHNQRLRAILEFEAPHRARICGILSAALFATLEREASNKYGSAVFYRGVPPSGYLKTSTAREPQTFCETFKSVSPFSSFYPRLDINAEGSVLLSAADAKLLEECVQSSLQSIVLSARVEKWQDVLRYSAQFWSVATYAIQNSLIPSLPAQGELWRAFFVVAQTLMVLVQSCNVVEQDAWQAAPVQLPMPDPYSIRNISLKNHDVEWTDPVEGLQRQPVDLLWIGQLVMLSVEMASKAKKPNRQSQLTSLLESLFGESMLSLWRDSDPDEAAPPPPAVGAHERLVQSRRLSAAFRDAVEKQQRIRAQSGGEGAELSEAFAAAFRAYDGAVAAAEASGDSRLYAEACHEFGDLLYSRGEVAGAAVQWNAAIDAVFGVKRAVDGWRQLVGGGGGGGGSKGRDAASKLGARSLAVAGIAAAKMASHLYDGNHQRQYELVSLATNLLLRLLRFSVPCPESALAYIHYAPSMLAPSLDAFVDLHCSSLPTTVAYIHILAELLLDYDQLIDALQLLALGLFMSRNLLEDDRLYGKTQLVKAKALVRLGFAPEGIEILASFGRGLLVLPKNSRMGSSADENAPPPLRVDISILEIGSWSLLAEMVERPLTAKLRSVYGEELARQFDVCRWEVGVQLLTNSYVNDPPVLLVSTKKNVLVPRPARGLFQIQTNFLRDDGPRSDFAGGVGLVATRSNANNSGGAPATPGSTPGFVSPDFVANLLGHLETVLAQCSQECLREMANHGQCVPEALVGMYVHVCNLLAQVLGLSNQRQSCTDRLEITLETCKKLKDTSQAKTSSHAWLQTMLHLSRSHQACGNFSRALEQANAGFAQSRAIKSRVYQLLFSGQMLYARLRLWGLTASELEGAEQQAEAEGGGGSGGGSLRRRREAEIVEQMAAHQQLISHKLRSASAADDAAGAFGLVLSRAWEALGDAQSILHPHHFEAIALAYDQADEALDAFFTAQYGGRGRTATAAAGEAGTGPTAAGGVAGRANRASQSRVGATAGEETPEAGRPPRVLPPWCQQTVRKVQLQGKRCIAYHHLFNPQEFFRIFEEMMAYVFATPRLLPQRTGTIAFTTVLAEVAAHQRLSLDSRTAEVLSISKRTLANITEYFVGQGYVSIGDLGYLKKCWSCLAALALEEGEVGDMVVFSRKVHAAEKLEKYAVAVAEYLIEKAARRGAAAVAAVTRHAPSPPHSKASALTRPDTAWLALTYTASPHSAVYREYHNWAKERTSRGPPSSGKFPSSSAQPPTDESGSDTGRGGVDETGSKDRSPVGEDALELTIGDAILQLLRVSRAKVAEKVLTADEFRDHLGVRAEQLHAELGEQLGAEYYRRFCLDEATVAWRVASPGGRAGGGAGAAVKTGTKGPTAAAGGSPPSGGGGGSVVWVSLPVRAVDHVSNVPETAVDRRRTLIVCWPNGRSTTPGTGAGAKGGGGGVAPSSKPGTTSAGGRRTSSGAGSGGAPLATQREMFASKVPESGIAEIMKRSRSALLALKKFEITRDPDLEAEATFEYRAVLDGIASLIVGDGVDVSSSEKPVLSVKMLEAMRRIFGSEFGYTVETEEEQRVMDWLSQIVAVFDATRTPSDERQPRLPPPPCGLFGLVEARDALAVCLDRVGARLPPFGLRRVLARGDGGLCALQLLVDGQRRGPL
ncbi:hypothetical protein DFJ73DRAFT_802668 [Zopfochytrium polystomum]|nr:hypothetical protein DFJ73DRAFT_802668 [Zopfochytrium polystomum]